MIFDRSADLDENADFDGVSVSTRHAEYVHWSNLNGEVVA